MRYRYAYLYEATEPNEANQDYARDLSEEMLRRHGRVTANGPRCNLDVITVVAEFVLGDGDLDTLANLNRTCKHIHDGTLPVLYETVRLDDEEAVNSVGVVLPRGWKYTKSHFIFQKPAIDIPRLALVVHQPSRKGERLQRHDDSQPIHLTLFRPLALSVIFTACRPFGRFASNVGISFFGTADPTHSTNRKREKLTKYRDIVGLTVKLGAYVKGVERPVDTEGWRVTSVGTRFKLEIEDEEIGPDINQVLDRVLEHLAFYAGVRPRQARLDLKCSAAVFECFTKMYHARQPLYLYLHIKLTTTRNIDEMKGYICALADTYSLHFQHEPLEQGLVFASIQAIADRTLLEWRDFDDDTREGMCPAIEARLVIGNAEYAPEENGFHSLVAQTFDGRSGNSHEVWSESHALAHIPFVPPLPRATARRQRTGGTGIGVVRRK